MVALKRAVLLGTAGLLLAAASAAGQERVPSEPIPVEWPADSAAAEPDAPADPGAPIVLPGVETILPGEESPLPWDLDPAGWWGVTLHRYSRVDGAVPGLGYALVPRDAARWPRIEGKIGFATTRRRIYGGVSIDQRLPLPPEVVGVLGVEWFHRSATFDDWKLSIRENDIATFVAGSDQMDWWRERGFRISLALESEFGERELRLSLLTAEQFSQRDRSPFALIGDEEFRENPPVEEGRLQSATVRYVHDTRDIQSPLLPAPGWIVTLESETAVDGFGSDFEFLRGMADVRRYVRLGRDAWWDHRWVVHAGRDLPPQRKPVLGGPGSLRGFRAASFVGDEFGVQGSTELRLPLPVPDWLAPLFLSWHAVGLADVGTVDDSLDEWHGNVGGGLSGINIFSYFGVFVAQRVTDNDEDDSGPRVIVRIRRDF